MPTPVDGDVYFSVRSYPDYGEISHRTVDEMDQGEGVEGAERKRDPLDFALWKAQKAGEDTRLGLPVGPRPARMAHRVLGDGREAARGRLRDPRRRLGSDLPPPRERGRADLRRARAPLARLWVHNGMVRLEREKMSKSVGNIFLLHEALDAVRPRRADHVLLRGPLPPADRVRRGAAAEAGGAGRARIREAARRLVAGPSPEWSAPLRERFFAALANDFNTPRALAAVFEWVREANRAAGRRSEPTTCERCSACWPGETCSRSGRREAPAEVAELPRGRERARAGVTAARPTGCATRSAAHGWEVRDGADGPELLPSRLTSAGIAACHPPRRRGEP